jgi:hypothetical protein
VTRWVLQLDRVGDAADDAVATALAALPGSAGLHLPGSHGPAAATWDVVSDEHPRAMLPGGARPAVLRVVDAVALAPLDGGRAVIAGSRVKRTLLLRVRADAAADVVHRFERDLAAMPRYIPAIRGWALGRVDTARGPSPWTHVWEQEYETVEGLRGDYMRSPYHWAGVDRWFDTELPDCLVDPELVHVFYESPGPVLPG